MIALLAALAAAHAPAPATQLGLNCPGTLTSYEESVPGTKTTKDFNFTFYVDLAAKTYCAGDCKDSSDLASVSATEIVLRKEHKAEGDKTFDETQTINRTSGAYASSTFVQSGPIKVHLSGEGTCSVVPFKPIPQAKF